MKREWKPGDAAVATWMGREVRGFIDTDRRFYTTDQSVKDVSSSSFALNSLRPLVVIDPEDRDQTDALVDAIVRQDDGPFPNRLQAALRELANPTPKVEEPMGLGAVVEDDKGVLWIRWASIGSDNPGAHLPWAAADGASGKHHWGQLNAVRVHSDGVTP